MDMKELYEKFMISRENMCLSDNTIKDYKVLLAPFLKQYGNYKAKCFSDTETEAYLTHISGRKNLAKNSKATYIRHFKAFMNWCVKRHGLKIRISEIVVPKREKRALLVYGEDEIQQIFDGIEHQISWLSARNKFIIALMLDCGLRQGEVCSLRSEDILAGDAMLRIHGKGSKERIVPMGNLTRNYYQEYLSVRPFPSDMLFVSKDGVPLTTDAVKHMVYKLSGKLPFPLTSHKLRHNFATNYCLDMYETKGMVDIYQLMLLMGHEEVSTTRLYLHHAQQIIAARSNISHLDKLGIK